MHSSTINGRGRQRFAWKANNGFQGKTPNHSRDIEHCFCFDRGCVCFLHFSLFAISMRMIKFDNNSRKRTKITLILFHRLAISTLDYHLRTSQKLNNYWWRRTEHPNHRLIARTVSNRLRRRTIEDTKLNYAIFSQHVDRSEKLKMCQICPQRIRQRREHRRLLSITFLILRPSQLLTQI